MPEHIICTKEKEISDINVNLNIMKNDLGWTKKNMLADSIKLDKILEIVNRQNTDLNRLNKDYYGNGVKGTKETIELHDEYISEQKGTIKFLSIFVGTFSTVFGGLLLWLLVKFFTLKI